MRLRLAPRAVLLAALMATGCPAPTPPADAVAAVEAPRPCAPDVESLVAEGKLDRARRTLERAREQCPGEEVGRLLAELDAELRGPKGDRNEDLADRRAAEGDAADARGDCRGAEQAFVAAYAADDRRAGALVRAGFAAKACGDATSARRRWDQALAAYERLAGESARVDVARRGSWRYDMATGRGDPVALATRDGVLEAFDDTVWHRDGHGRAIPVAAPGMVTRVLNQRVVVAIRSEASALVDVATGEVLRDGVDEVAVSPDGARWAVTVPGAIEIFDAATRKLTRRIDLGDDTLTMPVFVGPQRLVGFVASTSSSALFALDDDRPPLDVGRYHSTAGSHLAAERPEGRFVIHSLDDGAEVASLRGGTSSRIAAFAADGRAFVVADESGTMHVAALPSGRVTRATVDHFRGGSFARLDVSADGGVCASAKDDQGRYVSAPALVARLDPPRAVARTETAART